MVQMNVQLVSAFRLFRLGDNYSESGGLGHGHTFIFGIYLLKMARYFSLFMIKANFPE
jgi:hypothetical protein